MRLLIISSQFFNTLYEENFNEESIQLDETIVSPDSFNLILKYLKQPDLEILKEQPIGLLMKSVDYLDIKLFYQAIKDFLMSENATMKMFINIVNENWSKHVMWIEKNDNY